MQSACVVEIVDNRNILLNFEWMVPLPDDLSPSLGKSLITIDKCKPEDFQQSGS